jgi:Concanavalin A-like lectin/glucanases superfamily
MRRWFWFLLGVLVVLGLWSWARAQVLPGPPTSPLAAPLPLVRQHPILRGLVDWFRVTPPWAGGPRWYSLGSALTGTLTGMGSSVGWRRTLRPSASGEMGFDGVAAAIDLGLPTRLNLSGTFTFLVWIRPDVVDYPATNGAALLGAASASNQPGLPYEVVVGRLASGNIVMRWGDTDLVTSAADVLAVGVSAYVAVVREGTTGAWTGRIYLNGVEIQTAATSTNPTALVDGSVSLGRRTPACCFYQGAMDDVMLWNRALAPDEVRQATDLSRQGWPGVLRRQSDLVAKVGAPTVAAPSTRKGSFFPFLWPEQRR